MRSRVPPERLVQAIAHEIRSLGREYPFWTGTIAEAVSEQLARERVIAMLSGFFAVLALLLASIGLYGVMSYTVTRRTREIGIRVVLGAKRRTVLWMVLGETLALVLFGIAPGVPRPSVCRYSCQLALPRPWSGPFRKPQPAVRVRRRNNRVPR